MKKIYPESNHQQQLSVDPGKENNHGNEVILFQKGEEEEEGEENDKQIFRKQGKQHHHHQNQNHNHKPAHNRNHNNQDDDGDDDQREDEKRNHDDDDDEASDVTFTPPPPNTTNTTNNHTNNSNNLRLQRGNSFDLNENLLFPADPPIIYKYEIPKPPNSEGDDDISDDSSLDSQHNREMKERRATAKQAKLLQSAKNQYSYLASSSSSKLQQQRQEIKEKMMNEILEKILPNMDEYDIDGTNQQKHQRASQIYLKMIEWCKFIGCLELDLHDAVLTGSVTHTKKAILKITQGKNANPELINEYDGHGYTAISYAVKIKSLDLTQLLLDYNALPDFIDLNSGRTPLFYSVNNGTIEISKLLLQSGSNANAVDNLCISPLMLAATRNDVRHCQLLCSALADVDIQDNNGWTALHYAAYANSPEVIYFLLNEGANRHLKDRNRRKPMNIAKFQKHGNCVAALSSKSKIGF